MFMRSQREGAPNSNSLTEVVSRTATMIDDQTHLGADAISNFAHGTASQVGRASEYVEKQGRKLGQQARQFGTIATQRPIYMLLAVGVVGFGLGFILRGSRTAG